MVLISIAVVGGLSLLIGHLYHYANRIEQIEADECNSQYHERIWEPTRDDPSSP